MCWVRRAFDYCCFIIGHLDFTDLMTNSTWFSEAPTNGIFPADGSGQKAATRWRELRSSVTGTGFRLTSRTWSTASGSRRTSTDRFGPARFVPLYLFIYKSGFGWRCAFIVTLHRCRNNWSGSKCLHYYTSTVLGLGGVGRCRSMCSDRWCDRSQIRTCKSGMQQ